MDGAATASRIRTRTLQYFNTMRLNYRSQTPKGQLKKDAKRRKDAQRSASKAVYQHFLAV